MLPTKQLTCLMQYALVNDQYAEKTPEHLSPQYALLSSPCDVNVAHNTL